MWHTLSDNALPGIAALTAAAGLVGAWLKLRPRRIFGWLAAVKERETLAAMLENEREWRAYWEAEAAACQQALTGRQP